MDKLALLTKIVDNQPSILYGEAIKLARRKGWLLDYDGLNVDLLNNAYFNMRSLDTLFKDSNNLTAPINDVVMKKFNYSYITATKISDQIIVLQKYKNYYILFSVFSQIAGLLFLLLLFRNILTIIEKE